MNRRSFFLGIAGAAAALAASQGKRLKVCGGHFAGLMPDTDTPIDLGMASKVPNDVAAGQCTWHRLRNGTNIMLVPVWTR